MINTAEIRSFYHEAFRRLDGIRGIPPINITFYPYVGINHTIRVRDGEVHVRISELCRDMPAAAHQALALILVSKLYRKRLARGVTEPYSEYIKSDKIRERSVENRRERGRKMLSGTQGEHYDLNELFNDLNAKYFGRKLAKPALSWSARKTYRILGHHDSTHDAIIISRSLDSAETPRYVIEYVLYHEMLHVHHPTVHHNGRRYNHTAAFRLDEERFEHFHQAERWIEQNVRRLKRAVKKKKR